MAISEFYGCFHHFSERIQSALWVIYGQHHIQRRLGSEVKIRDIKFGQARNIIRHSYKQFLKFGNLVKRNHCIFEKFSAIYI